MINCQFCNREYEPSETGAQSIGCLTCVRNMSVTYDASETVKRCAGCGYQVSDLEKQVYGQVRKNDAGKVIEERHVCVFCHDPLTDPIRDLGKLDLLKLVVNPSKWPDIAIYQLKEEIRSVIYRSVKGLRLRARKHLLEIDFTDRIYGVPYRSDNEGKPILNPYQIEHEKVTEELNDLKMVAQSAYYDTLGRYGISTSDVPPAARNLTFKQKWDMAHRLKDRLRTLKTCRATGFYD